MDKVGKIKRFKLVEIQPNKFKRKTRHHQYKRIILINWINLNIKVILLNNKSPINYHIISKTKENMELKYLKTNKFKQIHYLKLQVKKVQVRRKRENYLK